MPPFGAHVAQGLTHLGQRVGTPLDHRPHDLRHVDQQQGTDHGEEGQGVDEERPARPEGGEHDAPDRRPEGTGRVELGGVEGDGVEQVLAGHELGHERLPGRDAEPAGEPAEQEQHEDDGDAPHARRPCRGQQQGEQELHGAGDEQHRPARVPVGERAAPRPGQHHRQVGDEAGEAEPGAAVGDPVDHERDGHVLEPGAAARQQRRAPHQAEVAEPERDERAPALARRPFPSLTCPSPCSPARPPCSPARPPPHWAEATGGREAPIQPGRPARARRIDPSPSTRSPS